ncbi:MAG: hydrogenase accessory protein HypA [Proteobacteria bacterium]|nr:MAG: hydrogenase accessory protein HypA [Pseudomonadota bacterium]PIE64566.1 MAG: hydrogenase accessory protein HypA [Desulfobacterales bacterium]
MHEISLVQGLLQQLHTIACENKCAKVVRLTMSVGPLSGVVIDSFTFGFDVLSKEDPLVSEAVLEIVIPEVLYRCSACGHEEWTAGKRPEKCGVCEETILIPEGGDDLILQQVEME